MKLDRLNLRQRWFRNQVRPINVKVDEEFSREIEKFVAEFKGLTKKRITYAYLMREGARQLMAQLRRDMQKAKRGEYHAKKRPANKIA